MAGKIKGITIVFEGETTKLDRALKKINQESRSVDQQLKEVNRALRFNPRNVELLRQKFTLLGQKVDATERQLKELRNAERQLKAQGVSRQSAEWMKVRREIIQAESRLRHFKAEANKLKFARVTAMGQAFKTAGANMRQAGMYATAGAAAMVMAGKKLLALNSTQEQAERKLIEIYKTRMGVDDERAKKTMKVASALQKEGVIGDEVTLSGAQQLATYAKMPGTIDKLLPAMDNLLVQQKGYNATAEDAQSIANLFGKAMNGQTGALKRVGISFTAAQEEVLKYGTEEEKAAMLSKVITENVGEMNKVFAETDEGKMAQLKNTLGDIGERLGHAILPALGQLATWISENIMPKVEQMVAFFESHPILAKIAVGLTALLAVLGPLLIVLGALISAIGTIMGVVGAVSAAFGALATPVLAVIAAIAAAIAIGILLYKNWDKIKAKAAELQAAVVARWQALKAKVTATVAALKAWVTNAFNTIKTKVVATMSSLKEKITAPFVAAKEKIQGIVDKIKGLFPLSIGKLMSNIKLPKLTLEWASKKFGPLGTIKYPTGFDIGWHAKGGIFDSPSVIGVGEAGPEAVVPLDKFWKTLEGMNSGDVTIVINPPAGTSVNDIAKEVERRLIDAQKRRRLAWQ